MADPKMGRYASVKLATTLIENFGRWRINMAAADINVSAFGTVWGKHMLGFQDWTATVEGMYDPEDVAGQKVLHDAQINATKIQTIRFYIDSTSYWTPATDEDTRNGCFIRTLDVSHDMAGVAQVTMEILGYGKIKLV